MVRVVGVLALSAVVSVLLASTAAARIDPCLLSPGEIQDVLDVDIAQDFKSVAECSYATVESADGGASVAIALLEAESKREAKQVFKEQRSLSSDPERVEDVGNAAFYTYAIGDTVVFRKGITVVSVTLLVFAEELKAHRDDVVALAEAAFANL